MEQALVSIVTPSYNTGKYIADTIQSVLNQTYNNWEMIIIDDCSTDNSVKVINSFNDYRIKLFINEENIGAAISRNKALNEAHGKWIAFLDSDDLWEKNKLEKQIAFMEKNNYYFSYTKYIEIDETAKFTGRVISGPNRINKFRMKNYCYLGCLTVMYDVKKVGLIQIENLQKNNDYAMWIKVVKITDCYLLDEVLAKYRKRSGSISNHSYLKLIMHHFYLWRIGEKKFFIIAILFTLRNLVFGLLKKIKYVKSYNKYNNSKD